MFIVGLAIGFFICLSIKYKYNFGDKKKIIEGDFKNKLLEQSNNYNEKINTINNEWKEKYIKDMNELKELFKNKEKIIKSNSVSSSRRSLVGKFIEKFIPFLSCINHEPSDMFFLGAPIDYVVFNGLNKDYVNSITFLEVKTGEGKLTKREESIKNAILKKNIFWEQIDLGKYNTNDIEKEIKNDCTSIGDLYNNINEKISVCQKFVPQSF